jgi:GT2 family glycosyltransferase
VTASSLIIPTWNTRELTVRFVRTLIRYAPGAEVIVVDNGSSDGTAEAVEAAATPRVQLRVVRHDTNLGYAKGCNAGLAAATGNVVVFLNSDMLAERVFVPQLLAPLEESKIGAVGALLLTRSGDRAQHAGGTFTGNKLPRHLYFGMRLKEAPGILKPKRLQWVTGACLAMRTADARKLGGFCEDYRNGHEDADLCFRVRFELGLDVYYEPAARLIHFEGKTSGRFTHENENARLFMSRWGDKIIGDHQSIVSADGGYL